MTVVVRTTAGPLALATEVRRQLRLLDDALPVESIAPMTSVVASTIERPDFSPAARPVLRHRSIAGGERYLCPRRFIVSQRRFEFGVEWSSAPDPPTSPGGPRPWPTAESARRRSGCRRSPGAHPPPHSSLFRVARGRWPSPRSACSGVRRPARRLPAGGAGRRVRSGAYPPLPVMRRPVGDTRIHSSDGSEVR